MLWKIKRGLRKQKMIDPNGNSVGTIICKGRSFEIRDLHDACVIRIEEQEPLCLQIIGEGIEGYGRIVLSEDHPFTRPPMAERMNVMLGDAQFSITQSPTREFVVLHGNQETGWIKGMPGATQILMAKHSTFEFVALLYILSWRMYHEDDIDIV